MYQADLTAPFDANPLLGEVIAALHIKKMVHAHPERSQTSLFSGTPNSWNGPSHLREFGGAMMSNLDCSIVQLSWTSSVAPY